MTNFTQVGIKAWQWCCVELKQLRYIHLAVELWIRPLNPFGSLKKPFAYLTFVEAVVFHFKYKVAVLILLC